MEAGQLVRMARRRSGLSQRDFAALAGVAERTVARWEAGQPDGSVAALARALGASGLELVAEPALPEPAAAVLHHLRLSLTRRLYLSLGGRHLDPQTDRRPGPWQELRRLAASTTDPCLVGRHALCLWLPGATPPTELVVPGDSGVGEGTVLELRPEAADDRPPVSTGTTEAVGAVDARDGGHAGYGVVVPVGHCRGVRAQPPSVLADSPDCTERRRELLSVAVALDRGAAVDEAGRRTPGHRTPQHAQERWPMFHATRLRHHPMPPEHDARSWRLDDDASLGRWLRRHGIPG